MKTLNQILEGTVEMSDYKLDKKGRKYKAHRMSMGYGMKESANPHNVEQIVENPTTIKQQSGSDRAYDVTHKATGKKIGTVYTPGKTNPNHVASVNGLDGSPFKSKEFSSFRDAHNYIKQSRGIDEDIEQIVEVTVVSSDYKISKSGRKYRAHRVKMGRNTDMANEAKDPREYDYEGDMAKSQLRSIIANAKQVHDMLKDDTNMAEWVQSKITLSADYISTVADYMQAEVNEEVEQVDEIALKPEHKAAIKRLRPSGSHSKTSFKLDSGKTYYATREGDDVHLVTHETGAGTSKKTTMKYSQFDEEVDQINELSDKTIMKYHAAKIDHHMMQAEIHNGERRDANHDGDEELADHHNDLENDHEEAADAHEKAMEAYKSNSPKKKELSAYARSQSNNLKEENESGEFDSFRDAHNFIKKSRNIDEARGRPAGAATLAKRAAAASKPREDDDEGEHYDSDSGVEADQHIHVQLKKAADSDQKPFEVSFKNGKKHTVSQKVAKDILSATERLKPEHRKNVHDEIHHSYDNLMSVHRLVARK